MAGISAAAGLANTATTSSQTVKAATDNTEIASNFTTFLQLLTTQLKNQNPLDPLDTNQFTQQLVQFAGVEQQMKSNDQLSTLVSLEQSAQATTALAYIGQTVVVDGSTSALANGQAKWTFNATKPATANVIIKDSTGQTAYTGTFGVQAGDNQFIWDGKGSDGKVWPSGNYSITVTGKDATGNATAISTQVQSIVDSVDLSQNPPTLSVNGTDYPISKITKLVRPS
ncbi:MAG: flagellar biosynthesis protein FlgD [Pseudolabrys sp.]|nr:flagellar biosynthesis protein FlgD [Pseudolabrys sp.]